MKLDVIDMSDAPTAATREKLIRGFSDGVIHMPPVSNGLIQMVDNVCNYIASSGGLNTLRIWGHGWSGGQLVSGESALDGTSNNNALTKETVIDNAYYLARLTPLFADDGVIELHGCRVAAGSKGEIFMCWLAQVVNVPVHAAKLLQGGKDSAMTYGDDVAWDGWVTVAYPDLSVVYTGGNSL